MKQVTSVITTINYPTEAVEKLSKTTDLIVVFDKKTPKDWLIKTPVLDIVSANGYSDFELNRFLPKNHYSRKNLGYLSAIGLGAEVIYDTDDDNIPDENWKERTVEVEAIESFLDGWFNVYKLFTNERDIWPRGFPLTEVKKGIGCKAGGLRTSSIQQGLSDGSPDVDAIFRLTSNAKIKFKVKESIFLDRNKWCPFNSQSTWWFPKAYPLMYLPVTASFRMTDIWRSFIAQRCLWEMGEGVTFHSPAEVFQDRNKHDLLKDFEDEIPGYLNNDRIVKRLSDLTLNGDVFSNLLICYRALVDIEIFPKDELQSVNAWVKDLEKIWKP